MSKTTALSFEDVNKHIEAADLAEIQQTGNPQTRAALSPAEVCAAYRIVKPILQLIAGIPLLPRKWRDALHAFMDVADRICP